MKHLYGNVKTGDIYIGAKELNGKRMDLIRDGEIILLSSQNIAPAVFVKKEDDRYDFKLLKKTEWREIETLKKDGWTQIKSYI